MCPKVVLNCRHISDRCNDKAISITTPCRRETGVSPDDDYEGVGIVNNPVFTDEMTTSDQWPSLDSKELVCLLVLF